MREPTIIDIKDVKLETYLSLGRPGTITSKSFPLDTRVPGLHMDFKWGSLSKDYGTPRHKHTFDQIRYQLSGVRQSDDGNMLPGDCAYFPEGVPYGPQQQEEDELGLILQFPGPSNLPYYTHEELNAARQKLLAEGGTFSGGIYSRVFPDGRKINKDSHQACTEFLYGAPIQFPKPRFLAPIVMRPDNYQWMPDHLLTGVTHKHLGTFGERRTGMHLMHLAPGTTVPAHTQDTAEIMYLTEGTIEYRGRTWQGGKTQDVGTFMFSPHNSDVVELTSRTGATFFVISLPMLREIELEQRKKQVAVSVDA